MTRRGIIGTLVYYLAAWVCGCLFMTIAVWLPRGTRGTQHGIPGTEGASGFLLSYVVGLITGAIVALVFGWLLRRVVALIRWQSLWTWMVVGAVLSPALIGFLANPNRGLASGSAGFPAIVGLLFDEGPRFVLHSGLWRAIPAGAATAFVLYFIQRAFQPSPGPGSQ